MTNDAHQTADQGTDSGSLRTLLSLHYTLQGKYLIALIGGLIVGGCLGAYMWASHTPVYTSQGWVRISPQKEVVLEEIETEIPMFSDYVQYQAKLMTTPRLIQLAMDSSTWDERPAGTGPGSIRAYSDAVNVRTEARQIISVSFEDEHPRTAQKGVEALLRAYNDVYGESDSAKLNQRLERLESLRVQLLNELRGIRQRKNQLAERYGTDDITPMFEAKQELMLNYQARLQEVERLIKLHELPDEQATTQRNHTPEEIANVDQTMAQLLQQRDELSRSYRSAVSRYGDRHRLVIRYRENLAMLEEEIERATVDFNLGETERRLGESTMDLTGTASLSQLRGQAEEFERLVNKTRSELEELNRQRLELAEVSDEIDDTQSKLDRTQALIDQIQIEASADGRVELVNVGDIPGRPSNDGDQARNALMAAVAGGGAFVGLCLLWGFADRRLRSFGSARNQLGQDAFLGVLPELSDDLDDPQQALATSHSVHEIRAKLQRAAKDDKSLVVGITSATAGSGKTSVSLALGLSFAATGSRTLLIDFDAVGGGLSSRTNRIVRRRQTDALVQQGVIPAERRQDLLDTANDARITVAQAAEQLGLAPATRVAAALPNAPGQNAGVFETLSGTPLYASVHDIGIDQLDILPIGDANIAEVGTVSRSAARTLIDQAREDYDVVIVDSGPILGSLEALISAGEVNEVVIVVGRGEFTGYVRRAIDRAVDAGANIAGLIFNRARDAEAYRFSTSSSITSRISQPDNPADGATVTLRRADDCPHECGPLAHATAACLPAVRRKTTNPPRKHQGAA